jgi:hypothetical protein
MGNFYLPGMLVVAAIFGFALGFWHRSVKSRQRRNKRRANRGRR